MSFSAETYALAKKYTDEHGGGGGGTWGSITGTLSEQTDLQTALDAKQNTLTFDNVPTENSTNPVKSGGVYSAVDDVYGVMGQNGAKNKAKRTGATATSNGVTFTVGTNEIVTATWSSTPTGTASHAFSSTGNVYVTGGKTYKVSGCPSSGAWESGNYKYCLQVTNTTDNTVVATDTGSGATFTAVSGKSYSLTLYVGTNAGASGSLSFSPMVYDSADTDPTYQPYAMTNRELTEYMPKSIYVSAVNGMTGGSNAFNTNFIPLKGEYVFICTAQTRTDGKMVVKANDVEIIADNNAKAWSYINGAKHITYDGNTPISIGVTAETTASLNYVSITMLPILEFKVIAP